MGDIIQKYPELLVTLELFELMSVLMTSASLISFRNVVPERHKELACDIVYFVSIILASFIGFIGSHIEVFGHSIIILAIIGIAMMVILVLVLIITFVQKYREWKKKER